jgi:carbamoyl-phosphate synthase small subunit
LKNIRPAILALSDGTIFEGDSFGAKGETTGEVVFNTSMMGYQEILTDPSYKGQLITMTYTEIGNYGTNPEDTESNAPFAEGFIVRGHCTYPSNWRFERGGETIDAYLKRYGIVGISGIDTRALTRHLRDNGAMEGVISSVSPKYGDAEALVEKAASATGLVGQDLVKRVSCKKQYQWDSGLWAIDGGYSLRGPVLKKGQKRKKVVAFDFGIKRNILRNLFSVGCDVIVVPASTTADEVLAMKPDGVFLSNGPGDPEPVTYAIETIKELIGKTPIFGICLGHQLLSLALGGKSYKLKFGHRGGNQPVKDLKTGRVEITSQNHGFAIDMDSLKNKATLTHINLNDNTVEGLEVKKKKLMSVQYHPEASPGPHDSSYLCERVGEMMG